MWLVALKIGCTPFIIGSEVGVSCVLFLDHGAGWIKTKTHETSTSEPMINGVVLLCNNSRTLNECGSWVVSASCDNGMHRTLSI